MDFEHKRGVPGKGKTENFGCFMAFSRSLNSPNGEFKTKKPVGLTGVFFIIFAHPYSRLVLRSLGKGGREQLHGRRKPTSSQVKWSVSGMKRLNKQVETFFSEDVKKSLRLLSEELLLT